MYKQIDTKGKKMQEFMVEFTIIGDHTSKEFQELVPSERARIDELLKNGEIKNIWLKEDYSGGYFIAYKEDEKALDKFFESLPLLPFLSFKSYALKAK